MRGRFGLHAGDSISYTDDFGDCKVVDMILFCVETEAVYHGEENNSPVARRGRTP